MAEITVFGILRKNDYNEFSEIALKVSPTIVLQDRVVLPEKIWANVSKKREITYESRHVILKQGILVLVDDIKFM